MKVTVIGCSTSWTDRATSSYCIDKNILVDCGEGTIKQYAKCGVKILDINTVFITHIHSDHILGLGAYISQKIVYDKENKFNLTIYGPKGLKKALEILNRTFACPKLGKSVSEVINIVEITDFSLNIKVGKYTVKPYKLKHGNILDIGYVFSENDKRVGFSGDCTYNKELENFIYNVDFSFVDCSGMQTTDTHMGVDKYLYFKNKYKNKRLIAVHCNDDVFNNAKKLNIEVTDTGYVYNI